MTSLTASALIILAVFLLILGLVIFFDVRKAKKHGMRYHFRQALTAFLMLLPACVLAYFFVLLPILYSLGYSFTNFHLLKPKKITFAGFNNFVAVFKDMFAGGLLTSAFKNTGIFVLVVVPLQIGLALGLALFCNVKAKGNFIFKVCFFTPVVISLAVTSYLWEQLLAYSDTSFINSILGLFKIEPQDFLNNPKTTMVTIAIISAWQGCGFQMLIFLSALTGIKKELYEAARMDGCNAWHRFLKVTLPGLRPTMLYVLITVFIGACRIMIQPMIMVGPHSNSMTLSYYMYQEVFYMEGHRVGYSSTIALFMTVIIGSITLLQRKLLGGKSNDR